WRTVPPGKPLDWPEIHLPARRPLEGEVIDRGGRPVAGAHVTRSASRSAFRTNTDRQGRFKLDITAERPGFLFVDASGFRFHGDVNETGKPVCVVLTRVDEPVLKRMAPVPSAHSQE